jgi:hypothetical protein
MKTKEQLPRELYLERSKFDLFFKIVDGIQKRADLLKEVCDLLDAMDSGHAILIKHELKKKFGGV